MILSARFPLLLVGQIGLILSAFAGIALAPPVEGPMLLIPLNGRPGSALNLALDHQARLIGAGPLPGSLIVAGRRASLAPAMLGSGVLVIAARSILCGSLASTLKADMR